MKLVQRAGEMEKIVKMFEASPKRFFWEKGLRLGKGFEKTLARKKELRKQISF